MEAPPKKQHKSKTTNANLHINVGHVERYVREFTNRGRVGYTTATAIAAAVETIIDALVDAAIAVANHQKKIVIKRHHLQKALVVDEELGNIISPGSVGYGVTQKSIESVAEAKSMQDGETVNSDGETVCKKKRKRRVKRRRTSTKRTASCSRSTKRARKTSTKRSASRRRSTKRSASRRRSTKRSASRRRSTKRSTSRRRSAKRSASRRRTSKAAESLLRAISRSLSRSRSRSRSRSKARARSVSTRGGRPVCQRARGSI